MCRLLDCKVYVDMKNSWGLTALDIVEQETQEANQEIKKMLVHARASRASFVYEAF